MESESESRSPKFGWDQNRTSKSNHDKPKDFQSNLPFDDIKVSNEIAINNFKLNTSFTPAL